jgi:DNA-binding MarR family transcriptional regulator
MKDEFLSFIDNLISHNEDYAKSIMTEDVKAYLEILRTGEDTSKPEITDNGKVVLKYMQDNNVKMAKSKDIAEGLGISSRAVSGTLRKLVNDGFAEKIGKDPVIYTLSEKGKNYKID